MTNPPVTLVTVDASLDEFSVGDYRDMVIELRQTYSLRELNALFAGVCSPALWAKVEHGEAPANRAQRNALRKWFNRKPLPLTVAECAAQASPDAAVWQVGDGTPETIIMIAGDEPLALRVNGSVQAQTYPTSAESMQSAVDSLRAEYGVNAASFVTPVTGPPGPSRERVRYIRPCATETQNAERIDIGATWNDVIDAGIETLKKARGAK